MLSRPAIDADAEPFYVAWLSLWPERPKTVVGGAFGGGMVVPDPLPEALIRAKGERLGYDGYDLDEFVDLLVEIELHFVELKHKRAARESREQADRAAADAARARARQR